MIIKRKSYLVTIHFYLKLDQLNITVIRILECFFCFTSRKKSGKRKTGETRITDSSVEITRTI